jgi:hypothetical protein
MENRDAKLPVLQSFRIPRVQGIPGFASGGLNAVGISDRGERLILGLCVRVSSSNIRLLGP